MQRNYSNRPISEPYRLIASFVAFLPKLTRRKKALNEPVNQQVIHSTLQTLIIQIVKMLCSRFEKQGAQPTPGWECEQKVRWSVFTETRRDKTKRVKHCISNICMFSRLGQKSLRTVVVKQMKEGQLELFYRCSPSSWDSQVKTRPRIAVNLALLTVSHVKKFFQSYLIEEQEHRQQDEDYLNLNQSLVFADTILCVYSSVIEVCA